MTLSCLMILREDAIGKFCKDEKTVKESLRSVIINIFFSHSYNLSDIKEKNCGPGRYQHQMEDKVLHSSSLLTRVTTGCNQNIVNYPQLFPITIHIFKMDLKCHPQ